MHKRQTINNLGDLPIPLIDERSIHNKRLLSPGEGIAPEWINPYSQVNIPFTLVIADESNLIIPANPHRAYVLIQNKDGAADIFINFGAAANDYNGIIIIPRGNYELIGGAIGGAYCPKDSIHLMCETADVDGVITEGSLLPIGKDEE